MQHYRVIFSGDVQGVFFRRNTYLKALELNLGGYVRNLKTGEVEAVFQGEEGSINEIIEYCRAGQPYAKVEKVKIEKYSSEKVWDGFSIK